MKKFISIVIAALMVFMLAACSDAQTDEVSTPDAVTEENTAVQDETQETESETEIVFEEMTVVDNEYCTIKITEIIPDDMWGYTLKLFLENKSSDVTYMFAGQYAAINGIEIEPFFASEVAPGKKANEEIVLLDTELSENGVMEYTDIEISFRVYDTNDWMADAVAEESVHIYPYGEANATAYVRQSQPNDQVIIDNENVTVIVTGYDQDGLWGYTVNLFLVNKTDTTVMFSAEEVSVNGFMLDPFYASSVSAGKCEFSSMSWFDTDFEDNGIENVENIELTFRAYNEDDWSADDYANEMISLVP